MSAIAVALVPVPALLANRAGQLAGLGADPHRSPVPHRGLEELLPVGLTPGRTWPAPDDLIGLALSDPGWLVVLPTENGPHQVIGGAGVKPAPFPDVLEIGYGLAPAWRGQGLGRAMVSRLLAVLPAHPTRVLAEVELTNEPSIRVLRRLGFRLTDITPAAGHSWWELDRA